MRQRIVFLITAMLLMAVGLVSAATTCTFTEDAGKKIMKLDADCRTDETLFVKDGWTLDGQKRTITAEDPAAGHFTGGVIENEGSVAYVKNVRITTDSLSNVCDGGADRLRGIMFDGASGAITNNEVNDINQGGSGCQEGNAIEVRNAPFDGTHPGTVDVEVGNNKLDEWQKTGIVANGDVDVNVHNNVIGDSRSTKDHLAPNSIQFGFGALGEAKNNVVEGSSWCGPSNFVGTAFLLFAQSAGVKIANNVISGDSDVGIFVVGDDAIVDNNKVSDDKDAEDCSANDWDIGVWIFGDDNEVTNNKVKNFDDTYVGVDGGKNKEVPGNQKHEAFK